MQSSRISEYLRNCADMRQVEKVIITREDERELREQSRAAYDQSTPGRPGQRQAIPRLSKQAMESHRAQQRAALAAASRENQVQGRAAWGQATAGGTESATDHALAATGGVDNFGDGERRLGGTYASGFSASTLPGAGSARHATPLLARHRVCTDDIDFRAQGGVDPYELLATKFYGKS